LCFLVVVACSCCPALLVCFLLLSLVQFYVYVVPYVLFYFDTKKPACLPCTGLYRLLRIHSTRQKALGCAGRYRLVQPQWVSILLPRFVRFSIQHQHNNNKQQQRLSRDTIFHPLLFSFLFSYKLFTPPAAPLPYFSLLHAMFVDQP